MNATPAVMERTEMNVRCDKVRVGDLLLVGGIFRRVGYVSFGRNGAAFQVNTEGWATFAPDAVVTIRRGAE